MADAPELRPELVRVIRQVRPQRILTWSPEWNWARFRTSCHADHRATGELALTAIYPDAGNRFAHPQLLENEGLEPWNVPEIWLINGREPNHYVDITEMFDRKVTALRAREPDRAPGQAGGQVASGSRRTRPQLDCPRGWPRHFK